MTPTRFLGFSETSTQYAHGACRGGAFNNDAHNLRAAYRNRNDAHDRNQNLGFRVAALPANTLSRRGQRAGDTPSGPGRASIRPGLAPPAGSNSSGRWAAATVRAGTFLVPRARRGQV